MTRDDFRKLALSFPEAIQSAHMRHPDFRVGGKIFATLGYPNEDSAVVKLSRDEQTEFVQSNPEVFKPVKGAWAGEAAQTFIFRRRGWILCTRCSRQHGGTQRRNGY